MNLLQKQFFALHEEKLPEEVFIEGKKYQHVQTFKYDFFAGTGLYRSTENGSGKRNGQMVVKLYRERHFFGLPMRWIGKLSAAHEVRIYKRLEGITGVPRFEGMAGTNGFAHEYIPGRHLERRDRIDDQFFDRLQAVLEQIHSRRVSYVDLHKPANIIHGSDGKPYLVDFQISYAPRNNWPVIRRITGWFLRQFQKEDWYHFLKHKRRLRRDLVDSKDYQRSYRPSLFIRVHRQLARPYLWVRHRMMDVLKLQSQE